MTESSIELEFNRLVERTQCQIRAYIAGMGAASHEVDDLAQDVYLEVYRNFHKIPADVPPSRWIKGVARNVCLNYFRRTARRGRLHREALAEILANAQSRAEKLVNEHYLSSALADCLDKLSADQQRLIELRYQHDLTSLAIGDRLNLTADAVRMTLYRIRTVLKNCIARKVGRQR